MIRRPHIVCLVLLLIFFGGNRPDLSAQPAKTNIASSSHLVVSFPSNDVMLLGFLFRPLGDGPFPAVVYHHRDRKSLMTGEISRFEKLAKFYTGLGYILLLPDRHSEQFTTAEFSPELQPKLANKKRDAETKDKLDWEKWDIINRDVVASVQWLQRQPDVITNRVVISGMWAGAMQSLMALEKVNVTSAILFAPATGSWNESLLLQGRLLGAARKSKAPVFLIYSQDQNLDPAEAFRLELEKKDKRSRLKIYPAMSAKDSALFPVDGVETWGPDVVKFLKETGK